MKHNEHSRETFGPGQYFTHDEIYRRLTVGNAGGIRICTRPDGVTRRAVLFSSVPNARITAENPYHDRREGDVLVYTGVGQEGDQVLGGRNKRILEQPEQRFPIYGFLLVANRRSKSVGRKRWMFLGMLSYMRHFKETQIDTRGDTRSVWIFEFRIHADFADVNPCLDTKLMNDLLTEQERKAPSHNDDLIAEKVGKSTPEEESKFDPVKLEQLRRGMLSMTPEQFKLLIRDVLLQSGFRDVHVTKHSQDGGIDVNALTGLMMWPIRNLLLQVQAKRWLHTVGRREVAELRGSLQPDARGTVVTTSYFSKAAMREAAEPGKKPIVLIDGHEFARIVSNCRTTLPSKLY